MRIPRFYIPILGQPGAELVLDGDEGAHLARVLRGKTGDVVEGFDGNGGGARLEVVGTGKKQATLRVSERVDDDHELSFQLTCAVAPPKGKRAHRMVEALTELGVTTLVPLHLTRNQFGPPDDQTLQRWIVEACKQCGRNTLMQTADPCDLAGLRALYDDHCLSLLPDTTDTTPLRDYTIKPQPRSVLVAIGPEGGFTDAERKGLRDDGFEPVRVGGRILRVETAAAAVVATLVAAWGE